MQHAFYLITKILEKQIDQHILLREQNGLLGDVR